MTQPFTPSQVYSKISFPAFNIMDALAALTRERSWDLSSVSGDILATLAAARTPAKPFIVGFIPPDVSVNFVPIQQVGTTLTTVTVNNGAGGSGSGPTKSVGQVPTVPTKLTPAQALYYLQQAGVQPPALYIVAAQSATETNYWGSGGKGGGFNGYNFGNITQPNTTTQPYMIQGGNKIPFAVYSDPQSGANAMAGFLRNSGALTAAAGGIDTYKQALINAGYLGVIGRTDANGTPVTQEQYDVYANTIGQIAGSMSKITPEAPPEGSLTQTLPNNNPDGGTPGSLTSSTSIMTNGNVTDPTQDPLAGQLGRNIQIANQQRVAAVQAQTNYLNAQISLIQQTPALMMLVNPQEFTRNYEQTTDPVKTRSGFIVNMWLEKPMTIQSKGVTAGQYAFQPGAGGGLVAYNRIQTVSYQNLMSLVSIFKNNGYVFTDDSFGQGNQGIPLIALSLYIYYDNHLYIGSFDEFEVTDDGNKPYNLSYTWKFTVRYDVDTTQVSDTFISTYGQPGSGFTPAGAVPPGINSPNSGNFGPGF
jgi:hypothetical protein